MTERPREDGPPRRSEPEAARVGIRKTWKLFVGGAFVRGESGRYRPLGGGETCPLASRKDLRDAVRAAAEASARWSRTSALLRGQILYRLAEVLEARRAELSAQLAAGGAPAPPRELDLAIDRVVSFAGWADKLSLLASTVNPVAGPYLSVSQPEPIGVVGLVAPGRPALLGLVGTLCPLIAAGNVAVVVAGEPDPRTALAFAECVATSDVPPGVVQVLTGDRAELVPVLARHLGVRGLDVWDASEADGRELEQLAADGMKRVAFRSWAVSAFEDARRASSPAMLERFMETKTLWHPLGA